MKFSKKVFNGLVNFINDELQGKVVDGITYTMKNFSSADDREDVKKYVDLRNTVVEELGENEANNVFRVTTIENSNVSGNVKAVMFELGLDTLIYLMRELQKIAAENHIDGVRKEDLERDLIADGPKVRHNKDIMLMANTINKRLGDKDRAKLCMAIYSRNRVPVISIAVKDKNNEIVNVKYDAFALRIRDMSNVNNVLKETYKVGIVSFRVGEVLPSKTGVTIYFDVKRI